MKTTRRLSVMICVVSLFFALTGHAEPLTPELCKAKAKAAAELVKNKGESAFAILQDPNGEFRFGDGKGYVWVHNLDGVMLMHPIKPTLNGKELLDLRDTKGHYLFMGMNELVEEKGEGWVPYVWPKPGEKTSSPKVSYVILVKHGGKDYVVGSGMYDVTAEDIKKLFPQDAVYMYN